MNQQIDHLSELEETPVVYGSLMQRMLASLIDGLILLPLAGLDWFNKADWKSQILLIVVFLIGLTYKPFLEFKFGATFGKKLMNLIVVDKNHQKVNLKEVLLRNFFDITWRTFFFIITLVAYMSEGFENIHTNKEFVNFQKGIINTTPYLLLYSAIIVIEIVFIVSDSKKRALHDLMGGTLVIKPSNK